MTRKQNVSDDGYQLKNNSLIFNYLLKIFQKNLFFFFFYFIIASKYIIVAPNDIHHWPVEGFTNCTYKKQLAIKKIINLKN